MTITITIRVHTVPLKRVVACDALNNEDFYKSLFEMLFEQKFYKNMDSKLYKIFIFNLFNFSL